MSKSTDTRPTAPPAEIHPLFGVLTDEHDADFWLCRNAECQTPLSNSPAENKRWAAFCTPCKKASSRDSQRRSREKARAKREEARAARAKTTAVSPLRARAAEKIDALAKSLFAVADMDLFLEHLPMFNKILAEARRVADLAQEVKNLEDAEHRTPGP